MNNPETNERLKAPEVARHRMHEVDEALEALKHTLEATGIETEAYRPQQPAPEAPHAELSEQHAAQIIDLHKQRARQEVDAAYDQTDPVVMLDSHTSEQDVRAYIDSLYHRGAQDDQEAA